MYEAYMRSCSDSIQGLAVYETCIESIPPEETLGTSVGSRSVRIEGEVGVFRSDDSP